MNATKMKTLIVDDEPIARRNLRALLRGYPEVELIGECGSGAQAVRMIQADPPDLLFLDVQMPEMNGFEVLKQIDLEQIAAVIFVTAYDQYALRAFDVQALDYLLKPFDDERFAQALGRARTLVEQRAAAGLKQRLLALLEGEAKPPSVQPQPAPACEGKFLIKSASRIFFVKAEEIDWVEAADYYVCLHVGGQSHLLRKTMAEMEAALDPDRFCRIHRSTIVNLSRAREVQARPGGEYVVILSDETALRLSRSRKEQIEQILTRITG
ncbi:MAG: LytR/AlgR family response regulator transcription factor [Blastocatellia bacterium]